MTRPSSTAYIVSLSAEEARHHKIMLAKDALKIFPDVGKQFNVRYKKKAFRSSVEAEPCICRGPDEPHVHYWLNTRTIQKQIPWHKHLILAFEKYSPKEFKLTVKQ